MKKNIVLSALFLVGVAFSAGAQNWPPVFNKCPDVIEGATTITLTGQVIHLGAPGQADGASADIEFDGALRIAATCRRTKGNVEAANVNIYKTFNRKLKGISLDFSDEIKGGAVNFRHETEPIAFSADDAERYCPSRGKNWVIDDYQVFVTNWSFTVTRGSLGEATVTTNKDGEACPRLDNVRVH